MTAIIVNPYDYDPGDAWEQSLVLLQAMCKENQIKEPAPPIVDVNLNACGQYSVFKRLISVNPKRCRPPVKNPGYAWSYTGYKADRTIPGVILHELGHHVHSRLGHVVSKAMRQLKGTEAPVSSYEPNAAECFAEAFRLFALNPDFLRRAWPLRWKVFTEELNLVPVITESCEEILVNAHPKMKRAARRRTG